MIMNRSWKLIERIESPVRDGNIMKRVWRRGSVKIANSWGTQEISWDRWIYLKGGFFLILISKVGEWGTKPDVQEERLFCRYKNGLDYMMQWVWWFSFLEKVSGRRWWCFIFTSLPVSWEGWLRKEPWIKIPRAIGLQNTHCNFVSSYNAETVTQSFEYLRSSNYNMIRVLDTFSIK